MKGIIYHVVFSDWLLHLAYCFKKHACGSIYPYFINYILWLNNSLLHGYTLFLFIHLSILGFGLFPLFGCYECCYELLCTTCLDMSSFLFRNNFLKLFKKINFLTNRMAMTIIIANDIYCVVSWYQEVCWFYLLESAYNWLEIGTIITPSLQMQNLKLTESE